MLPNCFPKGLFQFTMPPVMIEGYRWFLIFYFSLCAREFQVITPIHHLARELCLSPYIPGGHGESSFKEYNSLWASPARQNMPDLRPTIKNKRREDFVTLKFGKNSKWG